MLLLTLSAGAMLYGQREMNAEVHAELVALTASELVVHRSLDGLLLRHTRVTRRVREALTLKSSFERDSILAWAADGYARAMDAGHGEVSLSLQEAQIPKISEQMKLDFERLALQGDRLQVLVGDVALALERLVSTPAPDSALNWGEATAAFNRSDHACVAALLTAKATLTRAIARERSGLSSKHPRFMEPWAWLIVVFPILIFWGLSPILQIAKIARAGVSAGPPVTRDAELLTTLLGNLRMEAKRLEAQSTELSAELAKANVSSRRHERDSALQKIYIDNLVDNLRSGVVVTDPMGKILSFNRIARALFLLEDTTPNANIDATSLYVALQRSTTDASKILATTLETQELSRFEGLSVTGAHGERLLDLRVIPHVDESGVPRGLLWVADDITESVKMKNELIKAEHMATVGRISAQVAHEIRNPLSAIGLNAELLDEEFADGLQGETQAEARQLLGAIGGEVERLNEITEGYLELARMPSPKIQSCELNAIVTDLLAMSRLEFKQNAIVVQMRLAPLSPVAKADPAQVRQCLLNVVRNSMEAMPEGGTLQIETFVRARQCIIRVEDNGPGIPEDLRHRVCEAFYSTKPTGTGLGLFLTQQILCDHGGSLEIAKADGSGAQVTLTLPELGA